MKNRHLVLMISTIMSLVYMPNAKALKLIQQTVQDPLVSYAKVDLSKAQPLVVQPIGTSTIGGLAISSTTGAQYRPDFETWSLDATNGTGITFSLNINMAGRLQLAMEVAAALVDDKAKAPYRIKVINAKGTTIITQNAITDPNPNFHWDVVMLPQESFQPGVNQITIYLDKEAGTQLFVRQVKFIPQKIRSEYGVLNTTLFTQFAETELNGLPDSLGGKIWTRAYGLDDQIEMIPGPTFYFNPGDLLSVNLRNKLNPNLNPELARYDKIAGSKFNEDEALVGDSVRGEINIPHNLNNTNLHVHGLHVDPSKDDVTIVIVPEGETDMDSYDAPAMHHPVNNPAALNEFSVADQSVKGGSWGYEYKIPESHLPGTHWYHPHKHGSTSAQVENGLAGTIVIQENATNAIVPYPNTSGTTKNGLNQSDYDLDEWRTYHDRVLAIQEIVNYGAQFGQGNGKGNIAPGSEIDVTVNGVRLPSYDVRPGQLERWRLVNAGTNHRAFSHIWLGKDTGITDTFNIKTPGNPNLMVVTKRYKSVPIYLAAVDGVTLSELDEVTAENPALLAPGNRSDFLVQLEEGDYVLFKDYLTSEPITIEATNSSEIIYNSVTNPVSFWPEAAPPKSNPYLFDNNESDSTGQNYGSFKHQWNGSQAGGLQSMIPLIKTAPINGGNFLDVKFATKETFKANTRGLWQPAGFQGGLTQAELMNIHVYGPSVSANETPQMPGKAHLERIAPVTSGTAPSYVSPIKDEDVLQSRPVIFDVSGVRILLDTANNNTNNKINQFTLNGRYFVLNDPIGNPRANQRISKWKIDPTQLEYKKDIERNAIPQSMEFVDMNPTAFTNKVSRGDSVGYYFTNPGYYQAIKIDSTIKNVNYYSYDGTGKPTWELLTGIPNTKLPSGEEVSNPSVVNLKSKFYEDNRDLVDSLPLAQTAEEWILINNSPVSHPFHIHINPFFVLEVGQLSYEQYGGSKKKPEYDWFMRAVTAEGWGERPEWPGANGTAVPGKVYQGKIGVDAIVGNWWDTITIPAYGYVKVRYWFNVPNQTGEGISAQVADDYNKTGIWVYHCHILRHEDRGMMMPIITIANDSKVEKD